MGGIMKLLVMMTAVLSFSIANAKEHIITGLEVVEALKLQPVYTRPDLGVAVLKASELEKSMISTEMHRNGKCAGYELISLNDFRTQSAPFRKSEINQLDKLFVNMKSKFQVQSASLGKNDTPEFSQTIADAIQNVSAERLESDVTWMSSYETRKHNTATKNDHVNEMKRRLEALKGDRDYISIDLVDHNRTGQKTVRAIIHGSERPEEIIGLGAHFDSINQSFFQVQAPGADDDASGSANILEVFRLLLDQERPKRSIHFFWYAAEEVGLVGSAEIAQSYKAQNKDVIAVLQLDMTLYPGSGKFTMGLMTDFTSPWFNNYLREINRLYVKAKILDSKCGYGCSDHASWHRQGFAAAIPFESTMEKMNRSIHTTNDVIDSRYDFEHSAEFSKLGLAYAMSLANSTARPNN